MKKFALAALLLTTVSAHATSSFNFSYTFASGDIVNGSFSGNANGNLVTNLSNITAFFDGIAFPGNGSLTSYSNVSGNWVAGAGVASFDGRENSFMFDNGSCCHSAFISINDTGHPGETNHVEAWTNNFSKYAVDYPYTTPYSPARWTLIDVSDVSDVSPVPEPEAYAMLLAGLGLLGLTAKRRRQKLNA